MIVGIDLGTTNSLVAFINREGRPEIIINERGNRLTPSVVYFKNDREVMVGELARSQLILKADRTVSCIKRYIGSDYQVNVSERSYTPTEVSALILRKLVQYAEKSLGKTIEAAVVTVPAYFNDNQRQATLMAGEMAGLKILKLINEPTAAALAYSSELDKQEHILVLDIGGGTFDITLMEYEDKVCRVLSSGGTSTLGGVDFDSRLVDFILRTFQESSGLDLSNDPLALQQIQINAEKAKVDLSTVNECSVLIPYITMGSTGPVHLNQVISREQFNHLCLDLSNEIGEIKIMTGINPDEVVVMGAAMEAGMLSGKVDYVELHDVTSHTLGIEDDQGEFVSLIPANTSYPVIKSQLFTTVQDQKKRTSQKNGSGKK